MFSLLLEKYYFRLPIPSSCVCLFSVLLLIFSNSPYFCKLWNSALIFPLAFSFIENSSTIVANQNKYSKQSGWDGGNFEHLFSFLKVCRINSLLDVSGLLNLENEVFSGLSLAQIPREWICRVSRTELFKSKSPLIPTGTLYKRLGHEKMV